GLNDKNAKIILKTLNTITIEIRWWGMLLRK
ncbi:unnamed protein product, partial [marine sediment metagenome]